MDLANCVLTSRKHIRDHKTSLETPQCLDEYCNAIPPFLYKFFEGIIYTLLSKRCQIANEIQKRRKNWITPKEVNIQKVKTITTMLCSIILTACFTNTQFWLTRLLASLCKKLRLLSSLHQVLESVSIVSHSIKHERKLEVIRMSNANPYSYLISGSGVWNVCVIDNIDFKQKSFAWGNIYDVTRSTTHAILRLVFQFTLPFDISLITDETIELNEDNFMIGRNKDADDVMQSLGNIIQQFLAFENNYDGSFTFCSKF